MKQFVELHSLIPPARRSDTRIIGVSPDPMDELKQMVPIVTKRTGSEFSVTLLSDAAHHVIDLYGLRNPSPVEEGRYVPYPTTYVIDRTGIVRWKFTEKNQALRPTNEMILEQLNKVW